MKIIIETKPFDQMRYATAGDYWDEPDGSKVIQIADVGDWRMNLLIALHELIEFSLCEQKGIPEPDIKTWDEAHPDDDPGALKDAPYHRQHMFAEGIERLVALELGVNWEEYDDRVEALFE